MFNDTTRVPPVSNVCMPAWYLTSQRNENLFLPLFIFPKTVQLFPIELWGLIILKFFGNFIMGVEVYNLRAYVNLIRTCARNETHSRNLFFSFNLNPFTHFETIYKEFDV